MVRSLSAGLTAAGLLLATPVALHAQKIEQHKAIRFVLYANVESSAAFTDSARGINIEELEALLRGGSIEIEKPKSEHPDRVVRTKKKVVRSKPLAPVTDMPTPRVDRSGQIKPKDQAWETEFLVNRPVQPTAQIPSSSLL